MKAIPIVLRREFGLPVSNGKVFGLLPTLSYPEDPRLCVAFSTTGERQGADYTDAINCSAPVSKEDKDARELVELVARALGTPLRVVLRKPRAYSSP